MERKKLPAKDFPRQTADERPSRHRRRKVERDHRNSRGRKITEEEGKVEEDDEEEEKEEEEEEEEKEVEEEERKEEE